VPPAGAVVVNPVLPGPPRSSPVVGGTVSDVG